MGIYYLMEMELQVGKVENVLEMDGGDGHTTTRVYLMPQNSTIKNG